MDANHENPKVTAILLCYNHERFVRDCLQSVLDQTYKNIQVIIMDDCSRDSSPSVIREWIASRNLDWMFIPHNENQGICRTINEALRAAQGEFISIVSVDDVWLPEKTERQVELMLRSSADVGVVYSDALQIDEAGNLLPETVMESAGHADHPSGDVEETLCRGCFVPALTPLTRRRCYKEVGFYDESLFMEDWDMWLRISRQYQFAYCETPLAKYRIVSTSLMRTSAGKVADSAFEIFRRRVNEPGTAPVLRKLAKQQLIKQSVKGYSFGSPHSKRNLARALVLAPSLAVIVAAVFSLCGFSYATYAKFRRALWPARPA